MFETTNQGYTKTNTEYSPPNRSEFIHHFQPPGPSLSQGDFSTGALLGAVDFCSHSRASSMLSSLEMGIQASGHDLGISWGFHGDTMGILQCWGCATNGPTKFFTICGLAGAKPTCSRQIPSKKHRPLLMISWKPQLAPVNRWKPQMRPTRIDT